MDANALASDQVDARGAEVAEEHHLKLAGPDPADGCGAGHQCDCQDADPDGLPELDARAIPHEIRHATIFGALDGVLPGRGLVLVAPHDPLPLLAQLESRTPGAFVLDYLERGPEKWRLRILCADQAHSNA